MPLLWVPFLDRALSQSADPLLSETGESNILPSFASLLAKLALRELLLYGQKGQTSWWVPLMKALTRRGSLCLG